MKKRLLLLTPPLLQTNTPYPATMHLTGYLKSRGCDVHQRDLSIKVVRDILLEYGDETTEELLEFLGGPAPLEAKREASEVIDDLARYIRDEVDPDFGFSRYAEHLCRAVSDFGELEKKIRRRGVVDKFLERRLKEAMDEVKPDIVGVTCPFPGTLVGAFKIARWIRKHHPGVRLLLGGGYVSTELREMTDKRPYKYFDEFQFDEGYACLESRLEEDAFSLRDRNVASPLCYAHKGDATFLSHEVKTTTSHSFSRKGDATFLSREVKTTTSHSFSHKGDATFLSREKNEIPSFIRPSYDGIDWDDYFDVVETDNFVTNLWNSGKWVKLVMARGCYWHKCAFCDVVLPYIGCFQMPKASDIVDAMESLGNRFHFVDEAMPPALVSAVCDEILARGLKCEWWGNIRFDAAFTPALAKKMAKAGCICVTGGLECANDRLLKLMNKGITLASAEKVLKAFKSAKIFVHAYLMYDFPTETKAEQKGAEKYVRELGRKGLIQSCFWHRFALTVHSPIAKNPAEFGIVIKTESPKGRTKSRKIFARNELEYCYAH